MPRSRKRGGRKAHNRRVRKARLQGHEGLMRAGRLVIEKLLGDVAPQHPELVPFSAEPTNG